MTKYAQTMSVYIIAFPMVSNDFLVARVIALKGVFALTTMIHKFNPVKRSKLFPGLISQPTTYGGWLTAYNVAAIFTELIKKVGR